MTLQAQIENIVTKVDGFSLRERMLIFFAAAALVVAMVNALVLDPQLEKQKKISAEVVQQQEKMKQVQAQIETLLQARQADANSPLREQIRVLHEKIAEGNTYLQGRRDKLVPPEKMAQLLQQVLSKNGHLLLVALNTLPVSLLVEPSDEAAAARMTDAEKQIFKHGVKITVRGSYADLLQYLNALEKLPTQMFWGVAKMDVVRHPVVELTLTLYTLSLDKIWLQV
jgi:MSHA biogenesis protein MshJ